MRVRIVKLSMRTIKDSTLLVLPIRLELTHLLLSYKLILMDLCFYESKSYEIWYAHYAKEYLADVCHTTQHFPLTP